MKRLIVIALLTVSIVSLLPMTGCSETTEIPPDSFVTTWSLGQEGRAFSISGDSTGHAASKPSEFQLTLDNHSSNDTWLGSYCVLLVNREEIVKEIIHEEINIPAGQVLQKPLTVTFPVDVVKGSIGLCIVIPQRASMVTTLWVGDKRDSNVVPWPDITTCPCYLTEEGSKKLAENFIRNGPTFVFDGIEESFLLKETVSLLKENKPGGPETLSKIHGWSFIFTFENRHTGYGDRSGQMLAQVVTPHEVVIMVEDGEVTSAVMDGVWDMINQKMLNTQQRLDQLLDFQDIIPEPSANRVMFSTIPIL